ncbi:MULTISPECIES: transporter substrate-binding domain-containing protein [Marinobacter]|jgi:arginine/ornithine transport system substrate-binding protein|uniref:Transporter substrate-binding domain-containing protein n=1 Tax=Marinobacter vinifirmus TaxID=355591 RepID=A0A558B983_9GAMM|nr:MULTISPECIES: transporter substrate-binding domain-containing protein [Marinobacter]TVT33054.1 MAG: transporter substrate-binding domain-containing protein [Marinobacter vinifirmus]HBM49406.1 nickel transporter [Marinobacter sp.]|tara:strand:- start:1591 stop:2337 length:747 start_codon:yes stop_codon:yes gene_type:complete
MKKLIVAASCALAMMTGTAQAQDLRIAFDVPYEPFEYRDDNGELTGFEVELATAMCEELQANCEFVIQAWDGMIPGLLARKFDLIMSSMSITPERAERVLFSEPYYITPGGWFGPESFNTDVTDMDAMKDKTVGVQRGTTMDTYVTENMGGVVNIKRYTTAEDMVLDLEGQRLDVVFVDYPVGEQTVLNKEGYKEVGEPVKLGEGVGVAMRKRDAKLADDVNAALKKLKEDGTYDTIMQKYFNYDIKI